MPPLYTVMRRHAPHASSIAFIAVARQGDENASNEEEDKTTVRIYAVAIWTPVLIPCVLCIPWLGLLSKSGINHGTHDIHGRDKAKVSFSVFVRLFMHIFVSYFVSTRYFSQQWPL